MRIAVISIRFPPSDTMGSASVSSMVSTLHEIGQDMRVVAADDCRYPGDLNTGIPAHLVTRVRLPMARFILRVERGDTPKRSQGNTGLTRSAKTRRGRIARVVESLLVPDPYILWTFSAAIKLWRALQRFGPDFVISSGPPHSAIIGGVVASKFLRARHVVYLRDLWIDNPYPSRARLAPLQMWLESQILARASLVLTSTSGAKAALLRRYPDTCVEVFRSYPRRVDIQQASGEIAAHPPAPSDVIHVVHAGSLYGGRRDVVPLLRVLGRTWSANHGLSFAFFGDDPMVPDDVRFDLPASVTVAYCGRVSRNEALRRTCAADVALVLNWADEPMGHSVPGKLYEIVMLRKPVLVFGRFSEEIDTLLADAGLVHCVTSSADEGVSFLKSFENGPLDLVAGAVDPQTDQCVRLVEKLETFRTKNS